MTPKRSQELPEVPTLAESDFPSMKMSTWYGLFTTSGTPMDIQQKLHAATMRILAMPDVKKRLESLAGEPGNLNAAEFAALTRSDYERSGKLVRDAGIKGDQ